MKRRIPRAETWGNVAGWLLSPFVGWVARVRHSRMFHPEGHTYLAHFIPDTSVHLSDPQAARIGQRLAGQALVRFSSAWWKNEKEWPDALGCAVRFVHTQTPTVIPEREDQDLLFATIRRPERTPFAPVTTHVHSFLENDYYAVSPFRFEGAGSFKLRLVSSRPSVEGKTRLEKLERAVEDGLVRLSFEVKDSANGRWRNVGVLQLERPLEVDQEALRFSPFRTGRGIQPRGFVHMLRHGAYRASQSQRPRHA